MDLQKMYRKLLNKGRVDRVEAKQQPKGLSAKTVRNINQVISSAMDFAVAQKIGNTLRCGFSAGAHNCAMYSVYWDKPVMSEPFGVDNALLKPAACILGYAVTDYTFMKGLLEKMEG